ncbi:MAG: DUF2061 domain-containing protein [Candidatus Eisenbacteria bacterium]
MDTRKRSWVKSLTWRLFGIALLGIISLLITKNWKQMTVITGLFHAIRLILYYYHERIWERVSWGKVKHPLAELPVNRSLTPEDLEIVREKLKGLGYID